MEQNEQIIQLKPCSYKLYEMKDELEKTISTIEATKKEQLALIDCVNANTSDVDLSEFKKNIEDAIKQSNEQLNILITKQKLLDNTIALYEQNQAIKSVTETLISQLLIVLGVCAPEIVDNKADTKKVN